jgi:glycolate oxidase iron-sulfur subunit
VFPQTEAAMMDLLGAAGYTVSLAHQPECCGALAHHIGESDRARRFARELFAALPEDTPIVATAAGCGAHLKGLSRLFTAEADRNKAGETAGRTRDLSEALGEGSRPLAFRQGREEKVIYQDACHLRHGQDVTEQPRRLLRAAGAILEEVEEADLCCGSAGTYNIAQSEMAARLGRRKARLLSMKGPRTVVTHNPGCLLQLQTHLAGEMEVVSLARFLADRLAV